MLRGKLPIQDARAGKEAIAIGKAEGLEQDIETGLEQGLLQGEFTGPDRLEELRKQMHKL